MAETSPNLTTVRGMGRDAARRGAPLMANRDAALRPVLDSIQPGHAGGKVIDDVLRAWRAGWKESAAHAIDPATRDPYA